MIKTTTRVTINSRSRVTLIGTLGLTSFTSSSCHRMDVDGDNDSSGDTNNSSNNNNNNNRNNDSNNQVGDTLNVNNGNQLLLRNLAEVRRILVETDQRHSRWKDDLDERRVDAMNEANNIMDALPKSLTTTFRLILLDKYYDRLDAFGWNRISSYKKYEGQESVTRASLTGLSEWVFTNSYTSKLDLLLNDNSINHTDKSNLAASKERLQATNREVTRLSIEKVEQKRRWLALHNQLERMNVNNNSSSGSGARPDPNNSRD